MHPSLKLVADSQLLFDELKKALIEEFDAFPNSDTLSNEQLGQRARARITGVANIEKTFAKIARLRTVKEVARDRNPR